MVFALSGKLYMPIEVLVRVDKCTDLDAFVFSISILMKGNHNPYQKPAKIPFSVNSNVNR